MIWFFFAYALIGLGWGFFCRPAGLFNPWDRLFAYLFVIWLWPVICVIALYFFVRPYLPNRAESEEPNEQDPTSVARWID